MLFSFTLLTLMAADVEKLKPGDHTRSVEVDKLARGYIVHVPKSYDGSKATPVVLAFHGGGSDAQGMVQFCGLNDTSDREGFIAVYPNGTGRLKKVLTFNGGNCCGYAKDNNIDDVAFTRALLDDLAKTVNVDTKRVYSTGMSNGAIITYRLASELSDRIAAVAPVAGPMGTEKCSPKRPVPVIHFHGTADEFAPFKGGIGAKSLSKTDFYSVEHSIDAWIKANGCSDKPTVEKLPNKVDDGTSVIRKSYGSGKDGAEVVLIVIEGGGHTWPGHKTRLALLGKSTQNVSANDVMWEFFKRHPMK
jgi:polyhydroxybutyrate depolymerase